jgi:hypothetical protein
VTRSTPFGDNDDGIRRIFAATGRDCHPPAPAANHRRPGEVVCVRIRCRPSLNFRLPGGFSRALEPPTKGTMTKISTRSGRVID